QRQIGDQSTSGQFPPKRKPWTPKRDQPRRQSTPPCRRAQPVETRNRASAVQRAGRPAGQPRPEQPSVPVGGTQPTTGGGGKKPCPHRAGRASKEERPELMPGPFVCRWINQR